MFRALLLLIFNDATVVLVLYTYEGHTFLIAMLLVHVPVHGSVHIPFSLTLSNQFYVNLALLLLYFRPFTTARAWHSGVSRYGCSTSSE